VYSPGALEKGAGMTAMQAGDRHYWALTPETDKSKEELAEEGLKKTTKLVSVWIDNL
jgi:hypothetical protein